MPVAALCAISRFRFPPVTAVEAGAGIMGGSAWFSEIDMPSRLSEGMSMCGPKGPLVGEI